MQTFELTPFRRSALRDIADRRPGFSCQGLLGEFLDDYLVAESLLRRLISYYASDTSRPTSRELRTAQITAALNHFNLVIAAADVIDAFQGGPGTRGFKSARQLRNGFLHDLSPDDRDEILNKLPQIRELIDRVVSPLLAAAGRADPSLQQAASGG